MQSNKQGLVAAVAVFLITAGALTSWKDSTPDATPVVPGGPDLVSVFDVEDKSQARQDAKDFATLCASIADTIEFDGMQTKRRLQTGVQFDDFRLLARVYRNNGKAFSADYPKLPGVLHEFLTKELGDDGGEVDDNRRAKWVNSYRKLAKSAEYASNSL